MAYRYEIWNSIEEVNIDDWDQMKRDSHDLFMDVRFIRAIEKATCEENQFRYLIFYDEQDRPVASTCLCSVFSYYQLDSSTLENGFRKRVVDFINRIAPKAMYGTIVLCGLPISGVENQLRFAADVRHAEVLQLVDEELQKFAKEVKAASISFKDFTGEECHTLEGLSELGYRQADNPPMNHVRAEHENFAEFMASVRGKDRAQIRRSQKKFNKADLRVEFLTGKEGADKLYNEEVHKLYELVFERAQQRLEKLTPELLPEIVRQLPDDAFFMYIYQKEQIVAFCVSLIDGETYHGMYAGIDEKLNSSCDLYFNMFYQLVDHGLKQGVKKLALGQAADKFKKYKLGCYQVPLYSYVKGANGVTRLMVRALFDIMFPKRYPSDSNPAIPETDSVKIPSLVAVKES